MNDRVIVPARNEVASQRNSIAGVMLRNFPPREGRVNGRQLVHSRRLCTFGLFSLLVVLTVAQPAVSAPRRAAAVTESGDYLQFLDGSSLHGELQSIDPRKGVLWKHPDATRVIEFRPTHLYQVRFERRATIDHRERPPCLLRFTNGDEIWGSLVSLDEKELELETWFAGRLRAPRDTVRSLTFLPKGYAITYEGPTSIEGWSVAPTSDAWRYRDGAFVSTSVGSLGRNVHLPRLSKVEFDMAWTGQLSLIFSLYTDLIDRFDYNSSCYMFSVRPGYIDLQRIQAGRGSTHLGQVQIASLGLKNSIHLEIRTDSEQAMLALFADGVLVQQWRDPLGFVGQGTGISFYSQRIGPVLSIGNLRVSDWNGKLDSPVPVLTNRTEQVIKLVNNDKVVGTVRTIRNGIVSLTAAQTQLDVPLPRVTQILMARDGEGSQVEDQGAIRAFFTDGGTVSFQLAGWREQGVTGRNRNFGEIQLKPEWIQQIQFNPGRTNSVSSSLQPPGDGSPWIEE